MVSDAEIERIAVQEAIRYENALGWEVTSVETENRGYDLLSRKPHPSEPGAYVASRFIEVKGRAGVGEVGLSSNEFKTAQRLAGGLLALRRLQLRVEGGTPYRSGPRSARVEAGRTRRELSRGTRRNTRGRDEG